VSAGRFCPCAGPWPARGLKQSNTGLISGQPRACRKPVEHLHPFALFFKSKCEKSEFGEISRGCWTIPRNKGWGICEKRVGAPKGIIGTHPSRGARAVWGALAGRKAGRSASDCLGPGQNGIDAFQRRATLRAKRVSALAGSAAQRGSEHGGNDLVERTKRTPIYLQSIMSRKYLYRITCANHLLVAHRPRRAMLTPNRREPLLSRKPLSGRALLVSAQRPVAIPRGS
jgi:hypothetical protein